MSEYIHLSNYKYDLIAKTEELEQQLCAILRKQNLRRSDIFQCGGDYYLKWGQGIIELGCSMKDVIFGMEL